MRIAINIRLWLPGKMDGIGFFTAETVRRMVEAHPEHEFLLLCDRRVELGRKLPRNARQVVLCPPARHPVLWYLFFEWAVAPLLRKEKADIFLSTDGWMSLRTQVPTLTVMHDINFEHDSRYLRPVYQCYMKHFFPRFARHATRVATVSQFSKQDIARVYQLDDSKIDVVYSACRSLYHPLDEAQRQAVRRQYAQGCPFFLFVGTVSERKNLPNMLRAFERFKARDDTGMKFLVAGNKFGKQEELEAVLAQMAHREEVIFLGRTAQEALSQLLPAATALLFVSYFEGFGVPILEGFSSHTPVITGNTSSMPEVAGRAALLCDPSNTEQMADMMQQITHDTELRNTLIARGSTRLLDFSWDETERLLWDSLMQTYTDACKKD